MPIVQRGEFCDQCVNCKGLLHIALNASKCWIVGLNLCTLWVNLLCFYSIIWSSFKTSESQFERTYKDNDTYAAPSSDRVERLGYTSGYGGINVNWKNCILFSLAKRLTIQSFMLAVGLSTFRIWRRFLQPNENWSRWCCARRYHRYWCSSNRTKSDYRFQWWRLWW